MIFRHNRAHSMTTPPYITQVHSHGEPVVITCRNMRPISVVILSVIALLAILCTRANGFEISHTSNLITNIEENENFLTREKRDLESLDMEYPTGASEEQQEETGFWDRVVKVALKLFSRFIEWLNSS